MELWQILLGIAFFLIVLTFAYLLMSRIRRRERVIKILKEAKALERDRKGRVNNSFTKRNKK